MAYGTIEKRRKYAREWAAKYRAANKEEYNKKAAAYQKARRKSGKCKWYNYWKNDEEQKARRLTKANRYWKENKKTLNTKSRNNTLQLKNSYILRQLKKDGVDREVAKQFPILIEAKKETLKLKRLIYAR